MPEAHADLGAKGRSDYPLRKGSLSESMPRHTVTPWWGGMADADYADGCRCRIAVAGYPSATQCANSCHVASMYRRRFLVT